MLEVLDKSVWETVARQRVADLEDSMRASRRSPSLRSRLAALLAGASRRLDPSVTAVPCQDATPAHA